MDTLNPLPIEEAPESAYLSSFRLILSLSGQVGTARAAMRFALAALDDDDPIIRKTARQSLQRALAACEEAR